jgi:hypothetical protein
MMWTSIRKTSTFVHLSYGYATATLFAEDIRIRAADPFDVSIDLSKNLRTRHKSVGTYVDARELADGELRSLRSVQIDDERVIERIASHVQHLETVPAIWRLRVELEGSSWFRIQPEVHGGQSLILQVLAIETSTTPVERLALDKE